MVKTYSIVFELRDRLADAHRTSKLYQVSLNASCVVNSYRAVAVCVCRRFIVGTHSQFCDMTLDTGCVNYSYTSVSIDVATYGCIAYII